ncbi:MAG TPA: helix-turn-helix transcriptional regulator [Polyangiaceae bacterium]|nr:helix-turn-helix transcriptional regulator [Polyangiaceae bacterium]
MSAKSWSESEADSPSTRRRSVTALAGPADLEAFTFEVAGDQYALFEFSLREFSIPAQLSSAERQVATLILEGRSNRDIAAVRGTSLHTVANQVRVIYSKLGVSGRSEMVSFCVRASHAIRDLSHPG